MLLRILSPRPLDEERVRRIAELLDKEVTFTDKSGNVIEITGGDHKDIDLLEWADMIVEIVVPIWSKES